MLTQWPLPALALILLLPKCPVCLAGYIALWTGLSLSVAASSYLRWSLLGLSIAAIALNVVTLVLRLASRKMAEHTGQHS